MQKVKKNRLFFPKMNFHVRHTYTRVIENTTLLHATKKKKMPPNPQTKRNIFLQPLCSQNKPINNPYGHTVTGKSRRGYFSASWECYLVWWDSVSRSEQAEIHSFQTSRTGWSRQSSPQAQQQWFVLEPKKNMNVRGRDT